MVGERCRPAPGGSPAYPGSVSMTASGAELVAVDRVQRVQPLGVPAGALDAAVDPAQQRLGLRAASRGRPGPARSSPRRAASSSGSPSCGPRRAPRAATWSPRPGSRRSARGTGRAASARCAATRSRASTGRLQRRRPSPASAARRRAAARRRRSPVVLEAVRAEAQLQQAPAAGGGRGRPRRGRVSCPPSSTDRPTRRRGSRARSARSSRARAGPSPSGWSRIGTWPNSGRGANSSRARPVPVSTRTSVESPGASRGRVEPVGDGQPGPAGLDGHRARAGSAGPAAGRPARARP